MSSPLKPFITVPTQAGHGVVLRLVHSFQVPQLAIIVSSQYRTAFLQPHTQRVRFINQRLGIVFDLLLLFKAQTGECQRCASRTWLDLFKPMGLKLGEDGAKVRNSIP